MPYDYSKICPNFTETAIADVKKEITFSKLIAGGGGGSMAKRRKGAS